MQEMDVSISHDASRGSFKHRPPSAEPPATQEPAATPQKPRKVKPFTEIVRMRRPEKTRKQPNKFAIEMAARLRTQSQADTSRTSARTETTQREREMIYGEVSC